MPRFGAGLGLAVPTNSCKERGIAYHRVPRASAKRHSIIGYAETADPVIVALQRANALAAEDVPDLKSVSISAEKSDAGIDHIPCTQSRRSLQITTFRKRRMQLR